MRRLTKEGFILTETLVVSVVLLISFVFIFTQFLNIFAQYQNFERYHNLDSLYAAKNIDTFLKEDNYTGIINILNNNTNAGSPYYDFTSCEVSVFTFPTLCIMLLQDVGVERVLFTHYDITSLINFDAYTNDFSHELKSYILYIAKGGFSSQAGIYRVILEMKDGTFATFSLISKAGLITKQQYRYKTGYVNLNGGASNVITINKTMPSTLTIEMWAKASNMTGKMLWSFAYSTTGPALYFNSNQMYIYYDGSSYSISGTSPQPSLNDWHHYAMTFNGTNSTSYLYIDGKYVGSTTYRNPSGSYLYIGKLNNSTSYNWTGAVKEIKIWNKVLNPIEINNSMKNLYVDTTALRHYYKLSEGSGTTMIDYSTGGNITNALANVTWGVDNTFSNWIDGTPLKENMYAALEMRTLYYKNGKWVTEEDF